MKPAQLLAREPAKFAIINLGRSRRHSTKYADCFQSDHPFQRKPSASEIRLSEISVVRSLTRAFLTDHSKDRSQVSCIRYALL